MRKLYVKCNNTSRSLRFSIITSIVEDNFQKYVIKAPAFDEAKEHILSMVKNCEVLKKTFPEIYVSKAELQGDEARFEFIEGYSLADEYVECIKKNDKEGLYLIVNKHIDILKGKSDNECLFYETEGSRAVFGDLSSYIGKKAVKVSNFEAIARNILFCTQEKKYSFIDYEWVFDFPVPLEVYIYHCVVGSAYWTIAGFDIIISKQDLLKKLEIDESVEQIWDKFIQYINGYGSNVDYYKMKYLKGSYDVKYLLRCNEENKGYRNYISLLEKDLEKQSKYVDETQKYVSYLEENVNKQKKYIDDLEQDFERQNEYIGNLKQDLERQDRYIQEIDELKCKQQKYIENEENHIVSLESQIDTLNNVTLEIEEKNKAQQTYILKLEEELSVQNQYIGNLEHLIEKYIDGRC